MQLMELALRTAEIGGLAKVKVKITGPVDAEGCAELNCVEVVTNDGVQVIVLSDERGE